MTEKEKKQQKLIEDKLGQIRKADKDNKITPVVHFVKHMPLPFDTDSVLEVGDIIEFPKELPEILDQEFGLDDAGDPMIGESFLVIVSHEGKADRCVRFYPSSLTRNIWRAEEDPVTHKVTTLTEGGPLNPKGDVVAAYTAFQGETDEVDGVEITDVELGVINALLGKRVRIAEKTPITVQVWKEGEPQNRTRKTFQLTYMYAN